MVKEYTKVDPGYSIVDIGIIEDDVGALPAQLEGDLLQVGAGSCFHDLTANDGATGKGYLVDVHVGGDGGTGDLAETGDDVDDTWREAGFLDQVSHVESGQRGLLGGLENNTIPAGHGRADLPCPHEEGEVPRDDLTADTDLESASACGSGHLDERTHTGSCLVQLKESLLVSMILPSILSAHPP